MLEAITRAARHEKTPGAHQTDRKHVFIKPKLVDTFRNNKKNNRTLIIKKVQYVVMKKGSRYVYEGILYRCQQNKRTTLY